MKITKGQLRRIIREEKRNLQEVAMIGPIPSNDVYDYVHDEVLELVGEFLTGYGVGLESDDRSSFSQDDIRSLHMLVQEAAREAVETALRSVGITKVRG